MTNRNQLIIAKIDVSSTIYKYTVGCGRAEPWRCVVGGL